MKNLKTMLENLPRNKVCTLRFRQIFPLLGLLFSLCLVLFPYCLLITGKYLVNRVDKVFGCLCDGGSGIRFAALVHRIAR